MTTLSNRNHQATSISPRREGKPRSSLRVSRNDERLAGLEEGLEAAENLRPAFLHGLEGGAAPRELVVCDRELAHQSHRLDLVGHPRRPVLDELWLEAVHQLPSPIHL